jgi:hypothetical protein
VCGFKRARDVHGTSRRASALGKELVAAQRKQSAPLHILHDQIIRSDIVDLRDVGMLERRDRFGFPLETLAELSG